MVKKEYALMKFEEILPFLRSGHKIHSSEWDEGIYIYINEDRRSGDKYLIDCSGNEYQMTIDDLLADKWEVKLVHLSGSKEFIFIKAIKIKNGV